jgi:hypothetical protein
VTPEEARGAALAWLDASPHFATTAYTPATDVLEIKDRGRTQTIAYVLELRPRGFVIVTPHRGLNPVIAYSETSVFDATESPENILLDLLRGDVGERLEALEAGIIRTSYQDKAHSRWESYLEAVDDVDGVDGVEGIEGRIRSEGTPLPMLQSYDVEHGPFLTSEWGQSTDGGGNAAFNYYTPPGPDGDSDNYVCGCVATAFGQLLNYYEWPKTGTGSHSYGWNSETLSADFGATTYDWGNILDLYHDGGKTAAQRQAAGTLTYHTGVAVDMDYTSSGSGANTREVAHALQNHFRATADWVSGTASDFYDRLYANMINHRPGELSIRDTGAGAGHAVVVDGVRHDDGGTKYYHVNMGWDGTHDAWYDIASDFTTGSYTWDTVRGAILDVVPTPDLNDPGATTSGAAFPVSWDITDLQDAARFELHEAVVPDTPGSFTDGAEGGTGNWVVDGNWEQSGYAARTGSYSFKGCVAETSDDDLLFSSFTLDKAVKIAGSTTIAYWWGSYYFHSTEARLEISTNEKNWTALKTHTEANTSLPFTWHSETVTTGELAAYVGEVVSLRFVIDAGSGWYWGNSVGFYLDDFAVNNCYSGDWTVVDSDISAGLIALPFTESGEHCYRVRAYGCDPSVQPSCSGQWWAWSDVESITLVSDAYVSRANGSWSEGSTWEGGDVPPAGSSTIIKNGHTVSVNSNRECNDVVIESGGTLVVANGVTLSVAGDWVNNGTLTANNGTVTFNGGSAQGIGGDASFYNLTCANTSGGVTAGDGTLTVSNLLHVQSGTFSGACDLADVQIDSGAAFALSGDTIVSGDWANNGTFTHNSHGITFDGTTAMSGSSSNAFANVTVSGDLTAASGTMALTGDWSSSGSFDPNDGTIIFNGASAQTITASGYTDFHHLQIGDGISAQTVAANSDLDVNGDLTIETGASLAGGSNTIKVAGNWSESYTGFLPGASTVVFDGATQSLNKTLASTLITEGFDSYTSCCGWGASVGYPPPAGWARETVDGYGWLLGSQVANRWSDSTDGWLFTGAVQLESGVQYEIGYTVWALDQPPWGTVNDQTVEVKLGVAQDSASMTTLLDTVTTNSTTKTPRTKGFTIETPGTYYVGFRATQPTSGDILRLDDVLLTSLKYPTFYNLQVSSADSATFNEDVEVQNDLSIGSGATMTIDTHEVTVDGNWANSGTFDGASGSVTFGGSTTMSGSGTNNLGDVTIGSGATLNSGSANLTLAGDWANSGTFNGGTGCATFDGSSAQTMSGSNTFCDLTINNSSGVDASGSTLTVQDLLHVQGGSFTSASDLDDVQIDSGATLALSGDITASGNWSNSGTFTHNGHAVSFDGSSEQTVGGSSVTAFESVTVNSGATVVVETMPTVAGTLTNDGTLQQTQYVNGSSDVSFLDSGGYGGVIINANGQDLGSTLVTIQGNNADCTGVENETLKRCFDIAPTYASGRDASITFFFDSGELAGTGSECDTLNPYHFDGSSWELLTLDSSYDTDGRLCGSDPQSIRVINVSNFSPFVSKSGGPPEGGGPTVITLASFAATLERMEVALSLLALGAAVSLLLWVRRTRGMDGE